MMFCSHGSYHPVPSKFCEQVDLKTPATHTFLRQQEFEAIYKNKKKKKSIRKLSLPRVLSLAMHMDPTCFSKHTSGMNNSNSNNNSYYCLENISSSPRRIVE